MPKNVSKSHSYTFIGKEEDNQRLRTALVLEKEFWAIDMYLDNNYTTRGDWHNCVQRMHNIYDCYCWCIEFIKNNKVFEDKRFKMLNELCHVEGDL